MRVLASPTRCSALVAEMAVSDDDANSVQVAPLLVVYHQLPLPGSAATIATPMVAAGDGAPSCTELASGSVMSPAVSDETNVPTAPVGAADSPSVPSERVAEV